MLGTQSSDTPGVNMAPPKYTPNRNELARWIEEGLTHQQMADRVYLLTGRRVTREAISVAAHSYGLTKRKVRFKRELPWRVKSHHSKVYPVRMLRLLGRRSLGMPITVKDRSLLENWLAAITREGLIVAYDPDSDQGFHYIEERYRDHQDPTLPIRIRRIRLDDGEQRDCA
jgi:hypothetical protein